MADIVFQTHKWTNGGEKYRSIGPLHRIMEFLFVCNGNSFESVLCNVRAGKV